MYLCPEDVGTSEGQNHTDSACGNSSTSSSDDSFFSEDSMSCDSFRSKYRNSIFQSTQSQGLLDMSAEYL